MENLFVHIGMGTVVQRARIIFVSPPGTTTANRYIAEAKKAKPAKFHNATLGHRHRSVIVMDDGTVIMSTIKAMTLRKRLNNIEVGEEEEPDVVDTISETEEGEPETEEEMAEEEIPE